MRLGLFADVHDHLDHLRVAVELFNAEQCEAVLFAGDLVSTFAVPPLRKLKCPFIGCYGDNEGNKPGLQAGIRIIGSLEEPPVLWTSPEGVRFVLVHMERQLRSLPAETEFDIAVCGHTHRPQIRELDRGALLLNPGEVSGWTFAHPTVMLLETATRTARIVSLREYAATQPEARSVARQET